MSQVLRGKARNEEQARVYLEVLRTDDQAILALLDSDCAVTLITHPLVWFEIGEQYKDGKKEFHFDQQFMPLFKGEKHYPVDEGARKLIRGITSAPAGFKNGALSALVDVLPSGNIHLFTSEDGFVGRFSNPDDARMVAKAMGKYPVLLGAADDIIDMPSADLGIVLHALAPERRWPTNLKPVHRKEIFDMATQQVKSKAKKLAKAEAKQRRADGPVAQARALFPSLKDKTTQEIIEACVKAGINKNTAQTQLGKWRKENGITVKRGGPRAKKPDAKPDAKKPDAKKPDAKKADKGKDKKADKGKDKKGKKAKKKSTTKAKQPAPDAGVDTSKSEPVAGVGSAGGAASTTGDVASNAGEATSGEAAKQ